VDLAIAKTLLTPSLVIYSPASYQLLVTNVGPTDVPANTLITVTDQLDPGLTYTTVISSPATPVTWVCDSPPNGNLVHCIYSGGVGANQPLPAIIVTVNVLKGAGPITNCADVSVAANDNNLVNNHVCTIPNPVLGP
jgi:uncharacterized repeat protein (TIGR01451 family)